MIRRNPDYETIGSRYAHIEIWSAHHGTRLDPKKWIIHHKNLNKRDNSVCDGPEPCTDWGCGNLEAMTRADHIREHKPGKMSGPGYPHKDKLVYRCAVCGKKKSRNGTRCQQCYRERRLIKRHRPRRKTDGV